MTRPALTAMEASLAEQARALPPARANAFDAFALTGMPHRRMEAWKWTDIRGSLRDALPPVADNDVIAPSVFVAVGPFEITIMNGVTEWSGEAPHGMMIERRQTASLGDLAADHPLANLCAAFAGETLAIEISGVVAQPILLRRIAGAGAIHARAVLKLAAGAEATVIESFDGHGAFFSNSVSEYRLGEGSKLRRCILQNAGDAGVETALATINLSGLAALDQTTLSFGGKMARLETRLSHDGEGARAVLKSAIAGAGSSHADVTSTVIHSARGCQTRQTHKSALRDKARGVFQGKFLVARAAQKTDARMNADALLLSGGAEANHKPELEIYADDVECAHGSTAGALDEDAIFYMRQRGLDDHGARALLIEAFLGEVFDGIAHPGIERVYGECVARWLGAS